MAQQTEIRRPVTGTTIEAAGGDRGAAGLASVTQTGSSVRRQDRNQNRSVAGMSWKQIWIIIGLALLMWGLVLSPLLVST